MTLQGQSAMVHPVTALRGTLEVPGDKSISHRLAILASLASGTSTIKGFLQSEDCLNTLRAMEALGARSSLTDDGDLVIKGTKGKMLEPVNPLDLGNSGTSMRLLAGLIAGQPITVELTGDSSLLRRPMKRIKEPLDAMGAKVELLGIDGCGPVRVQGGAVHGITYRLPVASAQVKSCILLAGLHAEGQTVVEEPAPSRDHTERLLQALGVSLRVEGPRITLEGYGPKGPSWAGRDWVVPGDFSSAAFFLVAAAAGDDRKVTIKNVGLNPRRTALLDVLRQMGADVKVSEKPSGDSGEPVGDISVCGRRLHGVDVSGPRIPALIDELPLVAVAGALAEGVTVIRDAAELRVKESDRISVMAENLRRMNVDVEEKPDGLVVQGGAQITPRESPNSYGDHRVAMAMAVLGLYADKPTCVNNVTCIQTSNPSFWDNLRGIGIHVEW